MRKTHVKVTVDLFITANDDAEISDIINEMDYFFTDTTGQARIEDSDIRNFEVLDSR